MSVAVRPAITPVARSHMSLFRLLGRARYGIVALLVCVVVFVTLQRGVLAHTHTTFPIFRQSYHHLVSGQDLYAAYPEEQGKAPWDRFKYSPTSALLLGPFALPPLPIGLLFWNLLNAGILFLALDKLLPRRAATLAMICVFPWMFHAVQSSSSNALVSALIVFAFVALERGRQLGGAAAIAIGTLIKLFPISGVAFALFFPRRARFIGALLLALAVLIALPLLVTPPATLAFQYHAWQGMVTFDENDLNFGRSVMHLFRDNLGLRVSNWPLQVAGTILLLLPLALNRRRWTEANFRRRFLCSLLVYAVIFNHQAEHPSFVIAATGLAVWFVTSRRNAWRTGLFLACLAGLETLPYALVWLTIQAELLATPETVQERPVSVPESEEAEQPLATPVFASLSTAAE